jgi:hypothetical protein
MLYHFKFIQNLIGYRVELAFKWHFYGVIAIKNDQIAIWFKEFAFSHLLDFFAKGFLNPKGLLGFLKIRRKF